MQVIWTVSGNWQLFGSCILVPWYFKQLLIGKISGSNNNEDDEYDDDDDDDVLALLLG